MEQLQRHTCERCGDMFGSYKLLFKHIRTKHSHEHNFSVRCIIQNCQKTYHNCESYRRHLYRVHPRLMNEPQARTSPEIVIDHMPHQAVLTPNDVRESSTSNFELTEAETGATEPRDTCHLVASLLLKLKEKYHIPCSGLDDITNDLGFALETERRLITKKISEATNHDQTVIESHVQSVSTSQDMSLLSTSFLRDKYWREKFSVISPTEVVFGVSNDGKKMCAHYIPIEEILKAYISHDDVWPEVNSPMYNSKTHLEDFSDGQFLQRIFKEDTIYLQLYTDEFEVCNPLGAKRGIHKLFSVYFTVLNIPAKYRSKMDSIHLAMLVRQQVVKKVGINKILKPLVDNLTEIESKGLAVNGKKFNIATVIISGDNLGIHAIAGFSQSFANGRICRYCMATKADISLQFDESKFTLRSEDVHKSHLESVMKDQSLASTYGVYFPCVFNELSYFNVVDSLPPDPMHDLLEGVVQLTLVLVMAKLIEDKIVTLNDVNNIIESFQYHFSDRAEKPVTITKNCLDGKSTLKGSASQKWCFFRLLTIMIGEEIPSDNPSWQVYLKLRAIVDIGFAPIVPKAQVPYLRVLVDEFLCLFRDVFPCQSITPKMHYLIHYPRLMLHFGPLVKFWCMRFESQHGYFKSAADNLKCFINISLSLAKRYQLLQAHQFSSAVLLNIPAHTSKASVCSQKSLSSEVLFNLENAFGEELPETICKVNSITVDCVEYKKGGVYCFSFAEGLPNFILIEAIFLRDKTVVLYGPHLVPTHFNKHLHAYCVKMIRDTAVKADYILDHHVLPLYRIRNVFFVNMKYGVFDD